MASPMEETELPMLLRHSPSCNDDIPRPSSPGVADVASCLVLDPQPPARVRADADFRIVALLTCHPTKLQNTSIIAVATLLNYNGEEVPGKLLGQTTESGQFVSPTTTQFCFTLAIPVPSRYHFSVTLERSRIGLHDSWLHVKSEEITVTNERTSIVRLQYREVDIEYTYDTELFPWKRSTSRPRRVVLGDISYVRHEVIIPEAKILSVQTDLYHEPEPSGKGFVNFGEGLFIKDGVWYDYIDDNEESSLVATEEDEVLHGNDGQLYRKSIGCLQLYYVGLRREVVLIHTVRYIKHLVLIENRPLHADVLPVGLSPDGTEIVSPSHNNNMLNIWATDTCYPQLRLEGHTGRVFSVSFSPDGTKIASASYDTTLKIWDRGTGSLLRTLRGHTGGVFSVSFSPDGTMIASASYDNTRYIWYTDTGALLLRLEGYTAGVVSVAFSPDSTRLVEASANMTLNIRDTDTGAVLRRLKGHTARVSSVAFSPDGTKIASASYDTTLNIWDTDTGAVLWTLEGHTDKVRLLVFSPDSKLLALASHKAMWLWNYTKDSTSQTLQDNSGEFLEAETMTFSPDGKDLISALLDMKMRRWDTITGLLLPWKNLISPIAMANSAPETELPMHDSAGYISCPPSSAVSNIELLQPPPEQVQADVALSILLQPNKPNLLKRPSDGDIGGDLRNEEMKKHMEGRRDELQILRNLHPDYDPTTAQILEETRNAIDDEWLALVEKLKETKDNWDSQKIIEELLMLINQSGLNLYREIKEFDTKKRMIDSSQGQSTTVKQDRLFNFNLLLEKFKQLRNIIEEASTQLLRKGYCDSEDIMTKLKEARSVISNATSSQDDPTPLDSRATGPPAQIKPNDELEKHPSQLDAINSKPERGRTTTEKLECAASYLPTMPATEVPENNKDAVAMWTSVIISLLNMQSGQLILDDSKAELADRYMSEVQLGHRSERSLPGIDFITLQNENKEPGEIGDVPLEQMTRLLSGIPNARAVAFFILHHLPKEHHALLSCTTIFTEELIPVWRSHVLFEEWTEKERVAFVCKFSSLVRGSWYMKSVLQKWHKLLEILNPIIISIFSLCF